MSGQEFNVIYDGTTNQRQIIINGVMCDFEISDKALTPEEIIKQCKHVINRDR